MHVLSEQTRWSATAAIAGVLATSIAIAYADARPARQSASTSPADRDRLSATVTIRQVQLDAGSRPVPGSPPAMSFQLDRRSGGGAGRELTMTLIGVERPVVQAIGGMRALDHPFLATRMEHDARNGLRLYNARGERLRMPGAADRALFGRPSDAFLPKTVSPDGGREPAALAWVDDVLVAPEGRESRRAELERAHGPVRGSVRGLDRFVSTDGTNVDEVLVDPATALPIETNAVRAGTLVARTWMSYDIHPGGFLVRRVLRSERLVPAMNERRLVVEIELSNVSLTHGGEK